MTTTRDLRGEDTIDSREVIERIAELEKDVEEQFNQWWEDYRSANNIAPGADKENYRDEFTSEMADEDPLQELNQLKELEEEASDSPDWKDGETLIRDEYFTEYAQNLAVDLGYINPNASWPNNHIDWDAAAEELQQDYSSVPFGDDTYWIRS